MSDDDIRKRAIAAHGRAWDLLEKSGRTPEDNDAMIAAAEESLALWRQVGTAVNEQRGCWLVARTAVDAGRAALASDYAERTQALTHAHHDALADFDVAFAEEINARAHALAGHTGPANRYRHRARLFGEEIADEDDRREFFRQFALGPWFGIDADS